MLADPASALNLTQLGVSMTFQRSGFAEGGGHGFGALETRRDDGTQVDAAERPHNPAGLLMASLAQGDIEGPIDPACPVGSHLAMANEEDSRGAHGISILMGRIAGRQRRR
jgi:hypothetical protein